jgi:glycosyltransferase involved in cell wall biosynthesis
MIRVLYDHQMFDKQKQGGISRYFANLISGISQRAQITAQVSVLFTENYHLQAIHRMILNARVGSFLFSKTGRISKWNKNYSRYCIIKNDFDIFHPTYFHPYFLKLLKKPFVITVHDMIYELYPDYFKTNDFTSENKRKLIDKACHIIAISETTKADLIRLAQVPAEKITVVYHGHSPIKNSYVPKVALPEKYLLFVGARDNYKNFALFIRAASLAMAEHLDLKLVCVGGGAFTDEEKGELSALHIANETIHYDATDELLYWLYKGAKAFVYPSLYEGFGLPILEAFEADCPVILSDTPSFVEVAAEAALYFNPHDHNTLAECLKLVLKDGSLRGDLISLGQRRLKMFSMEKCITETVEVYKKCLKP